MWAFARRPQTRGTAPERPAFETLDICDRVEPTAPYTVPGRNLTLVSLANAPLEFNFEVTAFVVCVGLGLGAPLI